jgi:membrane protease YdiL (CAAX protease family)
MQAQSLQPRWPLGSNARLGHAIGAVFVQVGLNALGFGVIAPLLLRSEELPFEGAPMEFVALVAMTALGAGIGVGLALCVLGRVRLADLGWRPPRLADVGSGVLGFVACAIVWLAVRVVWEGGAAVRSVFTAVAEYSLAQRFLFVAIGVSAAFCEESIFRGYLQPTLVARMGRVAGIAASAAIFALYHLRFRPMSLLVLFAFGAIFGVLRERRGGLVAPAVAHALVWAVLGAA